MARLQIYIRVHILGIKIGICNQLGKLIKKNNYNTLYIKNYEYISTYKIDYYV